MIRSLMLGAALLFAGHALAASYTCHGKDDVYLCEADDSYTKFLGSEPSAAKTPERSLCDIPGWGCENSTSLAPNDPPSGKKAWAGLDCRESGKLVVRPGNVEICEYPVVEGGITERCSPGTIPTPNAVTGRLDCQTMVITTPAQSFGTPHAIATKGDIDAINKRLDEIKHSLRCLDDAVRHSKWTTEPCQ
jgi:hypothetical protein